MSEEEVEKFEITDHDLDNEFNMNRTRRKITKNEMIYGIWADVSSGEEDSGRASFRGSKKAKNYSAPIGFVAGGVHQVGKKKNETDKKATDSDDSDNEQRHSKKSSKFKKDFLGNTSSESDDEDERPASFKQSNETFETTGDIAGMRKKSRPYQRTLIEKGVGNWEKHTKGIGAKLLLQMGYEPGKGLGKELQGISAPIEAKLRKGRGAIGAYGSEVLPKVADMPGDSKKDYEEKLSRWRKDDAAANKRVKYIYKSIDEVIEQGKLKSSKKDTSALSKVKVIDMTGPQQRVLSGYHAISGQQRPSDEWEVRKDKKFANFAVPELLHNLNLLVDMCEQDIIQNDRKYKYASDKIVSLDQETKTLEKICLNEEKQIKKFETLISVIEELTSQSADKSLQLQKAAEKFKELQINYYEEYRMYEMSELATTLITPLIKDHLQSWIPLEKPGDHLELFKEWKSILELDGTSVLSSICNQDSYSKLMWHAWLPSIRMAVSEWNCRKPDAMIELIQLWMPITPQWIRENVLDQLVLGRLTLHVNEWDPMTDTIPIHAWVHPWLPLLGNRLDTVIHPMIRHKLSIALTAWHPSDRSAKLMLLPWSKAFSKGEMDSFLIKNILPKLAQTLDDFIINPQHQILDEHWKWVMEWEELLPVHSLATILEKHFFPKWLQVLALWLNHTPNYDQITSWYMGWKGLFSESLLKQPVIKDQFRKALDLMNRSVGSGQVPGAVESISYLKNMERETPPPSASAATSSTRYQSISDAVRSGSTSVVTGYKSLIAKRCEEKGILFVPINNKTVEGKQVYKCGKVQIYIDRNVIFLLQNNIWVPQSMSYILDLAEK